MGKSTGLPEKKYLRDEYKARINRVIDHIEHHIGDELTLEGLARIAAFSPFHFHRIFRAMVGEPLYRFIQRIRLEKAAAQLIANPGKPVTFIAYDCGFSGPAPFARAFREQFGISASAWRAGWKKPGSKNGTTKSKKSKAKSKERKAGTGSSRYYDMQTSHHKRRKTMINTHPLRVTVKEMPEFHVAYIRHIGPYQGDSALFEGLFGRLCAWAGARDLMSAPGTKMLAVYHDDPEITKAEKLRVSVCVTVPKGTPVDGEVGSMTVAGGKYAVARFTITRPEEYQEYWNSLYGKWLPESGYQPDDRPPYELYEVDTQEEQGGKYIVDICLPVKPL